MGQGQSMPAERGGATPISVGLASASAPCSAARGKEDWDCSSTSRAVGTSESGSDEDLDLTAHLSEDCLALVFGKLPTSERNSCALVCRRWLRVESQARQLLLLLARADIVSFLPNLLCRFEHLTKLALKCDRKYISLDDGGLFLVGKYARQLERLKLKGCRQVTDKGLEEFSLVCGPLRKLSCGSCGFGARGLSALTANCEFLEDLSVKKLKNLFQEPDECLGPGHQKLRRLCLKDLSNPHVFEPLIAGSKHLQTLILARLSGDWDRLLDGFMGQLPELMELRMEKLYLRDKGLQAVSRCKTLQILYVVKCPEVTNVGLSAVAQGCRSIRKLHLDGCCVGRMGDEGLKAIGLKCLNLQELVLIRLNVRVETLAVLGLHCNALERLAICNSDTFGDAELSCVVFRCQALKKLCIKSCPISDQGLEALAGGCPNLIKVKIRKCRGVSAPGALLLQSNRESLVVVVDLPASTGQREPQDSSTDLRVVAPPPIGRSSFAKARLALFAGSSFVACTLLRRSPRDGDQ